ncbi:Asp-tRNAAsn/Glu-tRNAGln amidotransferase A subunit and related amidases [Klebsiella pneumoniae subsp. pneumoniae ST512-K30BO]|nr:Asp-tRNAAsn/Glu-tRNAGln amidotransferase A subunit and related amidases [Klebsiella pneumoniae subsp. pneumoniae ST512-K30BO]
MTLHHFTIAEIQRALHDGELSAREIACQTLDDIARVNPQINAWTEVTAQRMLAEADSIDALRREKRPLPPLAGIPYAVKNLFDVAGHTTLAGAELLSDRPPAASDSWAVRQLHSAGALLSGMLNMDAYAYGFTTENSYYGATRNPHDLSRIAGGSSGGSAAAGGRRAGPFQPRQRHQRLDPRPRVAVRDLWPETHFRPPLPLRQPSVCRQSGSYWSLCPPGGRPRRGV